MKPQPITMQKMTDHTEPSSNWYINNTVSAPKTQGKSWNRGQNYCKSQNIRASSVKQLLKKKKRQNKTRTMTIWIDMLMWKGEFMGSYSVIKRYRQLITEGRKKIIVSLLFVQCRVVSPKTIYTQTTRIGSAGCVYLYLCIYLPTCKYILVCNNNNQRKGIYQQK